MTPGPSILIIDDDKKMIRVFATSLETAGYRVFDASSGQRALEEVRTRNPDVVLLDLGLPDIDGLALVPQLRVHTTSPIIVVSAREQETDKVKALDAGANDYLTKPFSVPELLARIRAALRRTSSVELVPTYVSNDLEIDFERRKLLVQGRPVRLTPKEFDLLRHLVASQGKPLEHRRLLQAVWGPDYGDETEYLRVFINQLRKKIEPDPAHPKYIHTDPWVGYRFEPASPAPSKPKKK